MIRTGGKGPDAIVRASLCGSYPRVLMVSVMGRLSNRAEKSYRTTRRAPKLDSSQLFVNYCIRCSRSISFCARFSSDSDHKTRPLIPLFFSTILVNITSF